MYGVLVAALEEKSSVPEHFGAARDQAPATHTPRHSPGVTTRAGKYLPAAVCSPMS